MFLFSETRNSLKWLHCGKIQQTLLGFTSTLARMLRKTDQRLMLPIWRMYPLISSLSNNLSNQVVLSSKVGDQFSPSTLLVSSLTVNPHYFSFMWDPRKLVSFNALILFLLLLIVILRTTEVRQSRNTLTSSSWLWNKEFKVFKYQLNT